MNMHIILYVYMHMYIDRVYLTTVPVISLARWITKVLKFTVHATGMYMYVRLTMTCLNVC